jgi:hypothetical protein
MVGGCLMGVYLTSLHLMGVHLMSVYFTGVHIISAYLMGVHLIDVYIMGVYIPDLPPCKRWSICRDLSCKLRVFALQALARVPKALLLRVVPIASAPKTGAGGGVLTNFGGKCCHSIWPFLMWHSELLKNDS